MTGRLAILFLALVLAAPAAASQAPEELWREYPLDPLATTATGTSTPASPPRLTPPLRQPDAGPSAAVGAAVPASDDGRLGLWWLAAALVLVGAPLAVVVVRRRLEAIPARAAVDAWSRHPTARAHSRALRRFARAVEATRAPVAAPVECVVRREGVVRARFVAAVEPWPASQRTIASSRSFWNRGYGADQRADEARAAWDDLIEDLQADGWELAPAWGAQQGDARPTDVDEVRLIRTSHVGRDAARSG